MGTLIWNRLKLRNSLQPLIGPIKQLNDRDKIWNKKNISNFLNIWKGMGIVYPQL